MNRISTRSSCRTCGAALQGRRDKLYCDDHCRVRYHRQLGSTLALRQVDRTLMRNRQLLRQIRDLPTIKKEAEETFCWLRRRGFDFNYHTHVEVMADGRTAVMCYEEGYVLEPGGVLALSPSKVRRLGAMQPSDDLQ